MSSFVSMLEKSQYSKYSPVSAHSSDDGFEDDEKAGGANFRRPRRLRRQGSDMLHYVKVRSRQRFLITVACIVATVFGLLAILVRTQALPEIKASLSELPAVSNFQALSQYAFGQEDLLLPPSALSRKVRVAVIETGGYHDEVVAAWIHAFGGHPNVELELVLDKQRFGITDIEANFELGNPLPANYTYWFGWLEHDYDIPDIIVSTTCHWDSKQLESQYAKLLATGRTYMFCGVHMADYWSTYPQLQERMKPWVEKGLIDFLTLSPHVTDFLKNESLSTWNATVEPVVRTMVPVYPVALPDSTSDDPEDLSFALQGKFEPSRRDYDTIFKHMESFLAPATPEFDSATPSANVTLHLIGSGEKPSVPAALTDRVLFDEGLSYHDFYTILSRTFALLPAFASDDYLVSKGSSTVNAGLIAGTPLVATRKMLEQYSFLDESVVWVQEDGETELEVVSRVVKMDWAEVQEKKANVKAFTEGLVLGNRQLAADWMRTALAKVEAAKS